MELKGDQKAVIMHDEGNLLVSASAGSGKTFTVIRRLIRLIVEKKARVSEILAVTFTEKAAAEMKMKLQNALIGEVAAGKEELKSQLKEVYTADISTVHAFCGRLLRKYFFDAGLSPDFEIADEVQAAEMRERALSALFEERYASSNKGFMLLANRHGRRRKDAELRRIVFSLYDFFRSEEDPEAALEIAVGQYDGKRGGYFYDCLKKEILSRYAAAAEAFGEEEKRCAAAGEEKLSLYAARLREAAKKQVKSKEGLPSMPAKCATDEGLALKGRLDAVRTKFFKAMNDYAELGEREEEISRFEKCREHTVALTDLTKRFAKRYAEEKRDMNVLDFSDLEHFALALLKDDRIRADIRGRYKYVFADEYQDTNGVQEAIFNLLTENNLFMVGDLKQSIYAFRGCNPALFSRREETLGKTGGVRYLNDNFRSAPAVIDGVNAIFGYCMKKEFAGVDYDGSCRLRSGGGYGGHRGRFSVDVLQCRKKKKEEAERKVYDVLEHFDQNGEDDAAGDFLADLIEEEIGKEYFDPETGTERNMQYGDIAVLIRSRNAFTERLVRRLTLRGIPVEAESDGVKESAEVLSLIDALKLADNFMQDIPLCSVLKNLYDVTDEELAEIRLFSKKDRKREDASFVKAYMTFLQGEGETASRLREANEAFQKLSLYGEYVTAGAFLRAVLAETAFERKIAASPGGERRLKNVERFLAEADASGCGIREFLYRIESAKSIPMSEAAGENSVKILTIHASKGLEYPAVFVVGIDKEFNRKDSSERLLKKRGYGFSVPFYDDEKRMIYPTVFGKYLKKELRSDTVREEMRLFYVALTRAKYSLHIVGVNTVFGSESAENASRYADFLPPDLERNECGERSEKTEEKRNREKIIIDGGDEELARLIEKNLNFVYPYQADTELKLKTSVTAEVAREDEDEFNYLDFGEETTAERGTAMHRFLEGYRFDGVDAETELARQLKEGLLTKKEADLLDMKALQRLFGGKVFSLLRGYELYKERWFMVNVPASLIGEKGGEIMLQGIVDLLAVQGGEAIIVDYKYSSKDAASLEKKYAKQLALYKYAVEKALGYKVKAAYLVSLAEAKAIAVQV